LIKHLQTKRQFSILQKKYHYLADPAQPQSSLPLMSLAVLNGSLRTIKLLAEEWGESLENKDSDANTYLHLAAMSGDVPVFIYLLNSGRISYQSKNQKGRTAI
jgi:ankyrin repeat protein